MGNTLAKITNKRMAFYRPSCRIVSVCGSLRYELAADGDVWIAAKSALHNQQTVLIRASSSALRRSTRYFEVQFSDRWNRKFTMENPLVLDEHDFDELVGFLHLASEDDRLPPVADVLFTKIAVLVDKYLFEGRLPRWCEQSLRARMCQHFPIHNDTSRVMHSFNNTGKISASSLPVILCTAYFLNMPSIFAIASRHMMWLMSAEQVSTLLPQNLVDIFPIDFAKDFREEALRLRIELRRHLPTVFFPDPHGQGRRSHPIPCQKCGTVPMEERWYREVISKSASYATEQQRGHVLPISTLFTDYATRMAGLIEDQSILADAEKQPPFDCARFRARRVDISSEELLWEIYVGIGGLCLKCVKGGEFRYERYCARHAIDLSCL